MQTQTAWAIDPRSDEGHSLLGRYWLFKGDASYPQNSVIKTRLFATRAEARRMLASMKAESYVAFPHARVVKVSIAVQVA